MVQDIPIFSKYRYSSAGTNVPYYSMVRNMKKATVDQKWHLAQCPVSNNGQQWIPGRSERTWKAQTDILQDFIPSFQGFLYDRSLEGIFETVNSQGIFHP